MIFNYCKIINLNTAIKTLEKGEKTEHRIEYKTLASINYNSLKPDIFELTKEHLTLYKK